MSTTLPSASGRYETVDWYDLPRYYDIVNEQGTREEADYLEALHERFGTGRKTGRAVLEPACGTGRLMREMARRGWATHGTDLNPHMLAYAERRQRRANLDGTFAAGDMADVRATRRFDLAHVLVSTWHYLLDEEAARASLRSTARVLRPGGLFVLGLHLVDYGDDRSARERWVGVRRGTKVVWNLISWPADTATRRERIRSRLVVEEKGATRRYETSWDFRTYDDGQLRETIEAVPELELVACHDFNYLIDEPRELDDSQSDIVLVLKKR